MTEVTSQSARGGRETRRCADVVHLVLNLNIGGLEKFVYDLARSTEGTIYRSRVLCLDKMGALGPLFDGIGVPVEELGVHRQGVRSSIFTLARRLRELKPDVLNTHNPPAHIVGAPAAWLAHVPAVIHTRHGSHRVRGVKTVLGYRLASWLTHRMIPISTESAAVARALDRVPERKLEVIRNGIDLGQFPRCRRPASRPIRKAIHVARIDFSTKDQPTLLRAVRRVVDHFPDFSLDVVGDGPDRRALESLCGELHLQSNVRFLGYRRDIYELLCESDLFLLSSATEGISIAILEAMAAGLPVVATDVGGNPDVVLPGETGLLVHPRSPDALAGAILELIAEPQRAAEMGRASRRRVEEEFDMRHCAAKYAELYRRVLEE